MESFLDILMAHSKARLGTSDTFIRWNSEDECFDLWKDEVPQWVMTFAPDTDPHDIERDLAIKLWQALA